MRENSLRAAHPGRPQTKQKGNPTIAYKFQVVSWDEVNYFVSFWVRTKKLPR